jgi:hypothetical protein
MSLATPSPEGYYADSSSKSRLNPKFREAASDHAGMLHPEGCRGRVVIAHKDGERWKQRSYDVSDLPEIIPAVAGLEDAYISQQRFYFKRTITQLQQLGALFVDVDFHTVPELAGMDARGVLEDVLIALERARMPAPTMAIASGRGLYVIWLHGAIPRAAIGRWNACQKQLWEILRPFGADRGALDAARVLRLAGTRNSKSGAVVEQIAPAGEVWNFDDLAEEILPYSREELYDLRIQRAARDARKPRESRQRPPQGFTQTTLWEGRLGDLQKLRALRWFEGDLPPGQRDHWMFLAGVAMSWIAVPQVLRRELWELSKEAATWNDAESGKRLSAIMKRAHMAAKGERVEWNGIQIDPRYRFKNSTIIELLEIEDWEQEEMSVIISSDEARKRHREREKERRREAGAMERSEYLGMASHNRREAVRLRQEGRKVREIADTLKLSSDHVKTILRGEGVKSVPLYGVAKPSRRAVVGGEHRQPSGNEVEEKKFRGKENAAKSELLKPPPQRQRRDYPERIPSGEGDMSAPLYGVGVAVGMKKELRGVGNAAKSDLKSFPSKERHGTGESIPSGEAMKTMGESESHPLGCDCLECYATPPSYAGMAK